MRQVFVDTAYVFAVFDPDDALHEVAVSISDELTSEGVEFVSTQTVLVEFLTLVRYMGAYHRAAAVRFVQAMQTNQRIVFVEESAALFDQALSLYLGRPDKTYSMGDCIGMVVCRNLSITDLLTHDKDFVQEGYIALLRETP